MSRWCLTSLICLIAALILTGCGGGNDPVNAGKDLPVPPKKEKDKAK